MRSAGPGTRSQMTSLGKFETDSQGMCLINILEERRLS